VRTDLRLSDLVARVGLFSGAIPAVPASGRRLVGAAVAGSDGLPSVPAEVAEALDGLSEASRRSVLDPLARGGGAGRVGVPARLSLPFLDAPGSGASSAPARQVDETTCGSAVLAMLAMAGDPGLALRVAREPEQRFAELQRRLHRASARKGPVPWPRRYGTPPWAAARVARYDGVRFTHRVVGRGAAGEAVRAAAVTAAASGVPVPLFSGGDLAGGWQTAVPRHVVLLTTVQDAGGQSLAQMYEPSSATLHTVPTTVLLAPDRARAADRAVLTAALGAWPHVVWAVLPR
jgi:hypothetical protein